MLLHTCCAPCALPIIENLLAKQKAQNLVLYFCNPNIYPEEEYQKRLAGVQKISQIYKLKLAVEDYDHRQWLTYLKDSLPHRLEYYPENDTRCLACFRFRLEQAAAFAIQNNLHDFATTLSVNRFKNIGMINQYGQELAQLHHLRYVIFELDHEEAYQKELELVKKYDLYSQNYCGCEFSMP